MLQLYSGDLLAIEAWELLKSDNNSYLVDVRTSSEWKHIGVPKLETLKKKLIMLEWMFLPDMKRNENFKTALSDIVPDKSSTLLFLCKSGGRSQQAAIEMTALGYKNCYNISDGFEGSLDSKMIGWKATLPWEQV
jgi:rhodanese-related sulfurtransferase